MGRSRHSPLLDWWRRSFVDTVDHRAVIDKVHEEMRWSAHFAFMTVMSAGIAVLGLLLSSPAVVIGAMLISPLMGPIIGFGFGLALFDFADIRRALFTTAAGVLLSVLFCTLIVALSPLQTVTPEIAARTRPNLFDLLVALFSGLAGTYAMVRGRHGAIVGVAIAVAVMPPLAVMGFGLATLNATVFWGSSLLFLTNLMTIGVSAAVLARLYGFGHQLSPRQTGFQATLVLVTFVG
ncbi:MAG: TIGR00341 family protein, partial [Pseudomonadota bacterium]|nr:TIGR00341 family protein [Pseudomonadota bacterium]